jgi:hypothetical protein
MKYLKGVALVWCKRDDGKIRYKGSKETKA